MGKKVIRLTENDLTNIVKRVINEQSKSTAEYTQMADELLRKVPKPTESGAKDCFTKNDLINDIKNEGTDNIRLYKIKTGDSISKLKSMTMQQDHMIKVNRLCNLNDKNGVKVNDVIIVSMLPSM